MTPGVRSPVRKIDDRLAEDFEKMNLRDRGDDVIDWDDDRDWLDTNWQDDGTVDDDELEEEDDS